MRSTALLFIAALFFSIACGKMKTDEIPLAEIGDRIYYSGEFLKKSRETANLSVKGIEKHILDNVIDIELIIEDAYKNKIESEPGFKLEIEKIKRKLLTNLSDPVFMETLSIDTVVSDDRIRELYLKLDNKYKLRHILVKKKETADSIYSLLKSKADFDELNRSSSRDRTGGKLGISAWDDPRLPESFKEKVFSLKQKEVSEPVEMPYGYHIVEMDSIIPYENKRPFEEEKNRLKRAIIRIRTNEKLSAKLTQLRKNAGMEINENLVREIEARRVKNSVPYFYLNDSIFFSGKELKTKFITYESNTYNLGEFVRFIRNYYPRYYRRYKNFAEFNDIAASQIVTREMLYREALEKGLDQEEDYKDKFNYELRMKMIDYMTNREIVSRISITEEEKKRYAELDSHPRSDRAVERELRSIKYDQLREEYLNKLKNKYEVRILKENIKKFVSAQ